MPRFFVSPEDIVSGEILVLGEDAKHISKVLRMKQGETLCLCDGSGLDYHCALSGFEEQAVRCKILDCKPSDTEPTVRVSLYVAYPKGDKLDLVVQKAVELGAYEVVPFFSKRCVARPDEKSVEKKLARLSKIAYEAAKQAGRGIVPKVCPCVSFSAALEACKTKDLALFLYENEEDLSIKTALERAEFSTIALVIGPEGGFEPSESEMAGAMMPVCSLGRRILRCETAPLAALAAVLYHSNNF